MFLLAPTRRVHFTDDVHNRHAILSLGDIRPRSSQSVASVHIYNGQKDDLAQTLEHVLPSMRFTKQQGRGDSVASE